VEAKFSVLVFVSCAVAGRIQKAGLAEANRREPKQASHAVWLSNVMEIEDYHGQDMHVMVETRRAMMYVGSHHCNAHKNLLLDRRTALQGLDARLQFLLFVVMVFANSRTGFILASLDLQSTCELATCFT
jgi:hypothetical protein